MGQTSQNIKRLRAVKNYPTYSKLTLCVAPFLVMDDKLYAFYQCAFYEHMSENEISQKFQEFALFDHFFTLSV
jgi:hypothetical protein